MLGGSLFLLGAVVTEMIAGVLVVSAGSYDAGTTTAPYLLALLAEEALELGGVLVALWAVLSEVRVRSGTDGARLGLREFRVGTPATAELN